MINHKYKCIFIHIPRTAGTSMELTIDDRNWVDNIEEKHLIASAAKYTYRDYWDDYFKFTIVRNPWDRMVSMTKFPEHYGCQMEKKLINVNHYLSKYKKIEIDHRATKPPKTFRPKTYLPGAVYLNILDVPINYVARFETLQSDWEYIQDEIKCNVELKYFTRNKRKHRKHYSHYYTEYTKQQVQDKYAKDIEHFNYKFEYTK